MQAEDDGADVTALMRCAEFEQRLLRPSPGEGPRCDDTRDEVLYVLEGSGSVTVGGESHDVAAAGAMFVARGTTWSVDVADGLRILSVLVAEPLPADSSHAVIGTGERGIATAGREFDLLRTPRTAARR